VYYVYRKKSSELKFWRPMIKRSPKTIITSNKTVKRALNPNWRGKMTFDLKQITTETKPVEID